MLTSARGQGRAAAAGRTRLERRLRHYWRLEAGNVLLVPLATWLLARGAGGLRWAGWLSLAACATLLIAGAAYWRAKHAQLARGRDPSPTLRLLRDVRTPLLGLTAIAGAGAAVVWLGLIPSASKADRIVALGGAVLAALEYVNYYHRQLQHFDHGPDLRRLLHGRGFRRSQMARDLAQLEALRGP